MILHIFYISIDANPVRFQHWVELVHLFIFLPFSKSLSTSNQYTSSHCNYNGPYQKIGSDIWIDHHVLLFTFLANAPCGVLHLLKVLIFLFVTQ